MTELTQGGSLIGWTKASLQRQFSLIAAGLVVVVSAVFLLVVTQQYKSAILKAHGEASMNVNLLLQAALENAMIKRDLEGLQDIVVRLGAQEGVVGVMIANPEGEVRFSSYLERLYQTLEDSDFFKAVDTGERQSGLRMLDDDREVLRSINPVHNQSQCQGCHGTIADNPINGLLIVDYDSSDARKTVWRGAVMLAVLGLAVLLLLEAGLWVALHRLVLSRVTKLTNATRDIAAGDLSVRTQTQGQDELARLGQRFDGMADQLETNLDELQSAHASLQRLIDAVPDGVRVIAPDFHVVMVNKAYCDHVGQSTEEVLGQFCYASSHGRDKPCVPTLICCPVVSILQQDAQELTCNQVHINAEGAEMSVELSAAPVTLRIDGREQRCVVESIRDLESDLSISQKQRLAEMGSLAAGVAHEVNNPLSSIDLALKAVKAQTEMSEEMEQYFEIAETEIANCKAITESLLRLSAQPQAEPELVELRDAIRDTSSLLRFEAEQKDIEIVQEVEGRPRVLSSDSDIRNLVFNLSLNAIHAMPEGGTLRIAARAEGCIVRLEIEDSGVGIPERDQAKILLPFWTRRADGSRGRGLGLAICSSIVKHLNGSLTFTSKVGEGTRFMIELPNGDEGVT